LFFSLPFAIHRLPLRTSQVARLEPETIAKARQELQPLQAALQQVLQEQKAYASGTSGGKSGGKSGNSSSSGGGGGGGTSIDERSAVAALFQRTQAIDEYGPMLPGLIGRLRSLQVCPNILYIFVYVGVCVVLFLT
jgi:hypothetical protein